MKSQITFYSLSMLICAVTGIGSLNAVSAQELKLYPGKTDVYYLTGNRLPPIKREDLDDFGKKEYDAIVADGRSFTYDEKNKEYLGPRSIRMYSPIVAHHLSAANGYLRYESGMDPKLRELTILNAAWEMNIDYEWTAHEETALEVGLPQETVDIVKYNKPVPPNLGEQETTIITLARQILRGNHKVSTATFAKAQELFGTKRLVEFVALLGGYTGTAMMLHTFDQQLPPGKKSLLPERSE